MLNNIFHFIFGLAENFNDKPFCYFHYLCIKSCYLTQNKPKIFIHCVYEPINNKWWDKIKEFVQIIKYKKLPDLVYFCNNKKVWRIEHQSDILRLLILKEYGGVYADIDTLFYKPFFPKFKNQSFVLGLETIYHLDLDCMHVNGLCNALIISNKNSDFLNIWLQSYKDDYDDYDWNKMSVRKPYELSKKFSNLIQIEENHCFHKYNWNLLFYNDDEACNFLTSYMKDDGIYSKHMAESKVFDYLKKINEDYFKYNNSLYSKMCKNIEGLLQ
jgi:hypothetical protein